MFLIQQKIAEIAIQVIAQWTEGSVVCLCRAKELIISPTVLLLLHQPTRL